MSNTSKPHAKTKSSQARSPIRPIAIPKALSLKRLSELAQSRMETHFMVPDLTDEILDTAKMDTNVSMMDMSQATALSRSIEEIGIQEPLRLVYDVNVSPPKLSIVRGRHRIKAVEICKERAIIRYEKEYEQKIKAYEKAVEQEERRKNKAALSGKTYIKRTCEKPSRDENISGRDIKIPAVVEIVRKGSCRHREDVILDITSNSMRRNLSLVEKCRGVKILKEDQKMTHQQIADAIGYKSSKTSERLFSASLFLEDGACLSFYVENQKRIPSTLLFSLCSKMIRCAGKPMELAKSRKMILEELDDAVNYKPSTPKTYKISDSWVEDQLASMISKEKSLSRHSEKIISVFKKALSNATC